MSPRTISLHRAAWLATVTLVVTGSQPAEASQEARTGPITRSTGADDAAKAALKDAPRRGKLGRMRGVRIVSTVTFVAAPDEPHELTLSAAFPARSRLELARETGRIERYQLGDAWFGRDRIPGASPARARSFELEGAELAESQLDLELRRALFLWPNETKFEGAGTSFTAKVGAIGVLLATVDEATGRPHSIRAFDGSGKSVAELRDVEWSSEGSRAWPKRLTFVANGEPLWREVVDRVEDEWNFADTWFLPSDRMAGLIGQPIDVDLRNRVVEAAWTCRIALPGRTTLAEASKRALSEWRTLRKSLEAQGLAPTPTVAMVLGADRLPVALEFEVAPGARSDARLSGDTAWTRRSASMAWIRWCDSADELGASVYDTVEAAVTKSGIPRGPLVVRGEVMGGSERGGRGQALETIRVVQAVAPLDRPKDDAKQDLDR